MEWPGDTTELNGSRASEIECPYYYSEFLGWYNSASGAQCALPIEFPSFFGTLDSAPWHLPLNFQVFKF